MLFVSSAEFEMVTPGDRVLSKDELQVAGFMDTCPNLHTAAANVHCGFFKR